MDTKVKRELVKAGAPLITRMIQMGASYHFEKKRVEVVEQHEVDKAEKRREKMDEFVRTAGAASQSQPQAGENQQPQPGQPEQPAPQAPQYPVDPGENVYQSVRELRDRVTCGFCSDILAMLEEEDPEVARRGYREIAEFSNRKNELLAQGVSQAEFEDKMEGFADEWQVIPRVLADSRGVR